MLTAVGACAVLPSIVTARGTAEAAQAQDLASHATNCSLTTEPKASPNVFVTNDRNAAAPPSRELFSSLLRLKAHYSLQIEGQIVDEIC